MIDSAACWSVCVFRLLGAFASICMRRDGEQCWTGATQKIRLWVARSVKWLEPLCSGRDTQLHRESVFPPPSPTLGRDSQFLQPAACVRLCTQVNASSRIKVCATWKLTAKSWSFWRLFCTLTVWFYKMIIKTGFSCTVFIGKLNNS